MKNGDYRLTPSEWNLMECLWKKSPRTGREATEYLEESVGWSRSTTLTMLRRMTEKGIIRCEEENGVKIYFPILHRQDTVQQETDDFLSRVYRGSISLMMNSITQKQTLSRKEINELYAILQKAEEECSDD